MIERSKGRRRKLFLVISIIVNVGTLFFFKYFNFFNANISSLAGFLRWNYSIQALRIALPLGLSFHTFQSLAYVIEVYRGKYPAERDLGIYALYVMFFPQLVAGPIERPQQLLPQLHDLRGFRESDVVQGLRIMLWGFFKKVVVADSLGIAVDAIYGNLHTAGGVMLSVMAVAFMLQLYADFSGYSDIARGSAKAFGVTLVNNFDVPFFSRSIAEFWRRWHISLSNWFRDYFYQPIAIPLARRWSKAGLYGALLFTFVVIGLWHGAAWTYVAFGTIFGIYMVVGLMHETITRRRRAIFRTREDTVAVCIAPNTHYVCAGVGGEHILSGDVVAGRDLRRVTSGRRLGKRGKPKILGALRIISGFRRTRALETFCPPGVVSHHACGRILGAGKTNHGMACTASPMAAVVRLLCDGCLDPLFWLF